MQTAKTHLIIECKNCAEKFEGKYCNNCGQAADTGRINKHYFLHALQHKFIKVISGFFYTIKELFVRPGKTIRDYIAGKRIEYLIPTDLVFLLAGMYGYLYHYYDMDDASKNIKLEEPVRTIALIVSWLMAHFSVSEILLIPFIAAGSFILFYKQKYNYLEHLVIATYIASQRLVVSLVMFPLSYIYKDTYTGHIVSLCIILAGVVLHIITFVQLFNSSYKLSTAVRSAVAYLLSVTLYLIIIYIAGVIVWNLGIS